jgi:hypothetical protein
MQPALPRDHFLTRANMKMVGISENNLGTKVVKFKGRDGFDGSLSADRHEDWRLNDTASGFQDACPGVGDWICCKERVCSGQSSHFQTVFPATIVLRRDPSAARREMECFLKAIGTFPYQTSIPDLGRSE